MVLRARTWVQSSLLHQIILLLLALMIVLVLAVNFVTRALYAQEIVRVASEAQQAHLSAQKTNIDRIMSEYAYVLFEMAVDRTLIQAAKELSEANGALTALRRNEIREQLSAYTSYQRSLLTITLWAPNGRAVVFDRTQYSSDQNMWQPPNADVMSGGCLGAYTSGKIRILPSPSPIRERHVYHIFFPIRDLYSRERYGALAISIDQAPLIQVLADQPRYVGSMLVDADGLIMCGPDAALLGKTLQTPGAPDVDGAVRLPENGVVQRVTLSRMGLQLVSYIDRPGLIAGALGWSRMMLLVVAVVCAGALLLCWLLLRGTNRNIRSLLAAIDRVKQGDLTAHADVHTENELRVIADSFNDMLRQLDASSRERSLRARQAMAALEKQHMAQIAALEAQINSHFLYNTLGSIHHQAEQAGNRRVAGLIKQLADCLRYTFEKSSRTVTAREEMAWLKSYLALQKTRFGDAFEVVCHLDPRVERWPMRKLIVQPFVENAIMHGLADAGREGCIRLEMRPFNDRLMCVTIADNGSGIPEDKLQTLRALFEDGAVSDERGIGLENASVRIRAYYKGFARVILRAWPGVGTRVVLLLPRLDDDEMEMNR